MYSSPSELMHVNFVREKAKFTRAKAVFRRVGELREEIDRKNDLKLRKYEEKCRRIQADKAKQRKELERLKKETEDLAQTLGFSLSALNAASAGPVAGVPAKAKLVQQHHREDRRLARVLHLAKSLQPQLPGNP